MLPLPQESRLLSGRLAQTAVGRDGQFWRTVNGNFLDIAVLEWCKLFADKRGKHFWRNVVSDPDNFYEGLLRKLRLTETQFTEYIKSMREYRNKFLAHLDQEDVMYPPRMRHARLSVAYLLRHIFAQEDQGFFPEAPLSAYRYYLLHVNIGRGVYVE